MNLNLLQCKCVCICIFPVHFWLVVQYAHASVFVFCPCFLLYWLLMPLNGKRVGVDKCDVTLPLPHHTSTNPLRVAPPSSTITMQAMEKIKKRVTIMNENNNYIKNNNNSNNGHYIYCLIIHQPTLSE